MKNTYKLIIILLAAGLLFIGCSAAEEEEGELSVLKIGATPVPHSEILEFVKEDLKEEGVELKIIEFTDYVTPNLSLEDGEIDANFFQHGPYLKSFSNEHGLSFVEVMEVHVEPLGLYSADYKKIEALPDGAEISIPNDPTNGGRALLLLAEFGLIDLGTEPGLEVTPADVVDNPRNFTFVELEAPQLPRSLQDVDAAVINTNYALEADLSITEDALIYENENSPYTNLLVTTEEKQNSEEIKVLAKVLSSDSLREYIKENYKGAVVPVF